MQIYRYEHAVTGVGPYHEDSPVHDALMNVHIDVRHLTWEMDETLRSVAYSFEAQWQAATASRKDLALWFLGFHQDLINAGFQLVSYEVPVHGVRRAYRGHQVAYNSLKADGRTVLAPHVQ
jgi:hypothetical protein